MMMMMMMTMMMITMTMVMMMIDDDDDDDDDDFDDYAHVPSLGSPSRTSSVPKSHGDTFGLDKSDSKD